MTREERKGRVLAALQRGHFIIVAAKLAGIDPKTVHEWRREDPKFAADVLEAIAIAEDEHLGNITNAARESWQASAWYLERKHNKRWGKKQPDIVVQRVESDGIALPADPAKRAEVHDALAAKARAAIK